MVYAIADGRLLMPEIHAKIRALSAERNALADELAEIGAEATIAVHPNLAETYRREIARLIEALRQPDHHEARMIIRDTMETIIATPRAEVGLNLTLQGRLAAIRKRPVSPLC